MIYVDEIHDYGTKGKWCHMWADDIDALHMFAGAIGLKRGWMHESHGVSGDFPHYDLVPSKRRLALEYGAQFMPLKEWVKSHLPTRQSEYTDVEQMTAWRDHH